MNLPNKLTILRIILSPVFIGLFLVDNAYFRLASLGVFLVAAGTDLADGYLARRYGVTTGFGRFMDPLADKVLVASAFVSFVALGYAPAWMVAVIIAREFFITGVRALAAYRGIVITPTGWAKVKTFLQMTCISVILLWIALEAWGAHAGTNLLPVSRAQAQIWFDIAVGVTAFMTAATGVEYVVKYYAVLRGSLK